MEVSVARPSSPFQSMAQSDPCVGQIIGGGVVIGGDQLPSGKRGAGQPRQAEIGRNGELQFAFWL